MKRVNESDWTKMIDSIKNGDKAVYKKFLELISKISEAYLLKIIPNYEDREELIQDILLSVHTSLDKFNTSKKFYPWLFSIIRFKTIDKLKKIYKDNQFKFEKSYNLSNFRDPAAEYNDDEKDEKIRLLQDALKELNPEHRKALELAKIKNISLNEISREMNWTLSKTKVIIHRSMIQLKKIMGVKLNE